LRRLHLLRVVLLQHLFAIDWCPGSHRLAEPAGPAPPHRNNSISLTASVFQFF
jgi:hypothetical protein